MHSTLVFDETVNRLQSIHIFALGEQMDHFQKLLANEDIMLKVKVSSYTVKTVHTLSYYSAIEQKKLVKIYKLDIWEPNHTVVKITYPLHFITLSHILTNTCGIRSTGS